MRAFILHSVSSYRNYLEKSSKLIAIIGNACLNSGRALLSLILNKTLKAIILLSKPVLGLDSKKTLYQSASQKNPSETAFLLLAQPSHLCQRLVNSASDLYLNLSESSQQSDE